MVVLCLSCVLLLVALRKESVDRNYLVWAGQLIKSSSLSARRAWIEMSGHRQAHTSPTSLSARRAWIEMLRYWSRAMETTVALRKESVDRNFKLKIMYRAFRVALRKESVDRNAGYRRSSPLTSRRSPQGERG